MVESLLQRFAPLEKRIGQGASFLEKQIAAGKDGTKGLLEFGEKSGEHAYRSATDLLNDIKHIDPSKDSAVRNKLEPLSSYSQSVENARLNIRATGPDPAVPPSQPGMFDPTAGGNAHRDQLLDQRRASIEATKNARTQKVSREDYLADDKNYKRTVSRYEQSQTRPQKIATAQERMAGVNRQKMDAFYNQKGESFLKTQPTFDNFNNYMNQVHGAQPPHALDEEGMKARHQLYHNTMTVPVQKKAFQKWVNKLGDASASGGKEASSMIDKAKGIAGSAADTAKNAWNDASGMVKDAGEAIFDGKMGRNFMANIGMGAAAGGVGSLTRTAAGIAFNNGDDNGPGFVKSVAMGATIGGIMSASTMVGKGIGGALKTKPGHPHLESFSTLTKSIGGVNGPGNRTVTGGALMMAAGGYGALGDSGPKTRRVN